METIIHEVQSIKIGRLRKLDASGPTSYVKDIVITTDTEQLVITMFADEAEYLEAQITKQGDNNDYN